LASPAVARSSDAPSGAGLSRPGLTIGYRAVAGGDAVRRADELCPRESGGRGVTRHVDGSTMADYASLTRRTA